jgi:hypothetical protein
MGMLPYAARGAASIAVAATGERSEVRQVAVDVILLHRCNIITSHWSVARSVASFWVSLARSVAFEGGEVSMYVLRKSDPSSWELCM